MNKQDKEELKEIVIESLILPGAAILSSAAVTAHESLPVPYNAVAAGVLGGLAYACLKENLKM